MQLKLEEESRRKRECSKDKEAQKWADRDARKQKMEAEERERSLKRAQDEAVMKQRRDQIARVREDALYREMSDRTNIVSDITDEKAQENRKKLDALRRAATDQQQQQRSSPPKPAPAFHVPETKPFERRQFPSAPSYEERHRDSPGSFPTSNGAKFARFYFNLVNGQKGTVDHVSIAKDDCAWKEFEAKAKRMQSVRLADIPFPKASGCLDNEIFKRWAMRWHPDKFMQKYGRKLHSDERESIHNAVQEVFQDINAAR